LNSQFLYLFMERLPKNLNSNLFIKIYINGGSLDE